MEGKDRVNAKAKDKTPVTIISGFLGSGKTTLLKHILENTQELKIALIVNDMAELNIDAALVRRKGAELSKMEGEDGKMVELDNGCICCSLKPNMVKEISRLCKMNKFNYIVIESSGICEPMPIAEAFYEAEEEEETEELNNVSGADGDKNKNSAGGENIGAKVALDLLGDLARLDTMVTVVDATRFWEYINSLKTLVEHYGKEKVTDNEEGMRSIAELLVDQVEFANIVVINKIDLMNKDKEQLEQVKDIVKALNPNAKLLETSFSKIDPKNVLSTGLFDIEKAAVSAGWAQALRNETHTESKSSENKSSENSHSHAENSHSHAENSHSHEHKHGDHYGITSFVYRRRKPFHPERLKALFDRKEGIKGSMRSKGFCWLASRSSVSIEWNMAGKICGLESGGSWYAEDSDWKEEFAEEPELLGKVEADFVEPWGDRRIELVIIGINMDQKGIEASLDTCLLTEEEMKSGPEAWARFHDPFPKFVDEEDD